MSDTAQKETEFVSGAIEGITQKKADTWTVQIKPDGSQYTKALWTKDSELVAALAQKIGQNGAFACNVSHWTNSEGKPVRSLWIGQMDAGTHAEQESPPNAIPSQSATSQTNTATPSGTNDYSVTSTPKPDVDWDAKERRDYRSRAWAQTLGAFQHTIKVDEDPVDVFKRLQPFQRKVFSDVCGAFAFPPNHDDIPFA